MGDMHILRKYFCNFVWKMDPKRALKMEVEIDAFFHAILERFLSHFCSGHLVKQNFERKLTKRTKRGAQKRICEKV